MGTLYSLARALHMTDTDVLAFACEVGEASATADGPKLLERGPHVIAAVERMWDLDELGLRTKWIERAGRVLGLLRPVQPDDFQPDAGAENFAENTVRVAVNDGLPRLPFAPFTCRIQLTEPWSDEDPAS